MKKIKRELGIIELGSEVYVSDPCYDVGNWYQVLVRGMKPGRYYGFMYTKDVDGWGERVTDLWVAHENNVKNYPTKLIQGVTIGVDSGGAGIFDKGYYEEYHPIDTDKNSRNNQWYERQFDLRYYYDKDGNKIEESYDSTTGKIVTSGESADGIAMDNKCVISFSGFGDGCYNLYAGKNSKGEVISLRIRFI